MRGPFNKITIITNIIYKNYHFYIIAYKKTNALYMFKKLLKKKKILKNKKSFIFKYIYTKLFRKLIKTKKSFLIKNLLKTKKLFRFKTKKVFSYHKPFVIQLIFNESLAFFHKIVKKIKMLKLKNGFYHKLANRTFDYLLRLQHILRLLYMLSNYKPDYLLNISFLYNNCFNLPYDFKYGDIKNVYLKQYFICENKYLKVDTAKLIYKIYKSIPNFSTIFDYFAKQLNFCLNILHNFKNTQDFNFIESKNSNNPYFGYPRFKRHITKLFDYINKYKYKKLNFIVNIANIFKKLNLVSQKIKLASFAQEFYVLESERLSNLLDNYRKNSTQQNKNLYTEWFYNLQNYLNCQTYCYKLGIAGKFYLRLLNIDNIINLLIHLKKTLSGLLYILKFRNLPKPCLILLFTINKKQCFNDLLNFIIKLLDWCKTQKLTSLTTFNTIINTFFNEIIIKRTTIFSNKDYFKYTYFKKINYSITMSCPSNMDYFKYKFLFDGKPAVVPTKKK